MPDVRRTHRSPHQHTPGNRRIAPAQPQPLPRQKPDQHPHPDNQPPTHTRNPEPTGRPEPSAAPKPRFTPTTRTAPTPNNPTSAIPDPVYFHNPGQNTDSATTAQPAPTHPNTPQPTTRPGCYRASRASRASRERARNTSTPYPRHTHAQRRVTKQHRSKGRRSNGVVFTDFRAKTHRNEVDISPND